MEGALISTNSKKVSSVFQTRKKEIDPKELVQEDGQINFGAFWQALWLCRDNIDLRQDLCKVASSTILSEESLNQLEVSLPQLLCLLISEGSIKEASPLRRLIFFACLHSVHTAVLAHLLLQALLRRMSQEVLLKKKKVFKAALDKAVNSATKELRNLERLLLLSSGAAEADLEKRLDYYSGKVEELDEYIEKSLFKGPVYFRKAKALNRDQARGMFSKFIPKFLKIKNGFLFVHNDENHSIDMAIPLSSHLRETPLKFTRAEENQDDISPEGTHHFFEIELDSENILQFEAFNQTARSRWIKNLLLETEGESNVHHLVKDFDAKDERRTEVEVSKLQVLRVQSAFINVLEEVGPAEIYSVVSSSKSRAALLKLTSLAKNVLEDSSGSIMTFDCERLGESVVEFLYRTTLPSEGGFFSRFRMRSRAKPQLLQGGTEKKEARPEENKMIWFVRNSSTAGELQREMIGRQWAFLLREAFKRSSIGKELANGKDIQECTPSVQNVNVFLPVKANGYVEEVITGAVSLEGLRKKYLREEEEEVSLLEHFEKVHEGDFEEAQERFARSLAGAALLAYLLELKGASDERHLLLLNTGNLLFSEFSGCFSGEKSDFVLTDEMTDLLTHQWATTSPNMLHFFVNCCFKGLLTMRQERPVEILLDAVKVVSSGCGSGFFDIKECAKVDRGLRTKLNLSAKIEVCCKKFLTFLERACQESKIAKQIRIHYKDQFIWL